MAAESIEQLLQRIEELKNRLAESEQVIEAIKAGEVDAFTVNTNGQSDIYTLQSGDYAYRVLIEKFGEGALNLTEDGLIVYTNTYFFQLLALSYEEVIGSLLLDFVQDESKEKFHTLFQQAVEGASKGEINLLVNGRVIPVYISLTSLQPKLATVGVIVTDLTQKKKNEETILRYQQDLEAKNLELSQSNTELASFTFIASHDLQEPLRKIKTFSKLILQKELENITPKANDYFRRIIAASERMQNLITALLNYSRTNTSDIVLSETDLNKILLEVRINLRELIDENNARIETSLLPTIHAVPLQINQLFSNILINAIKFRKRDVAPEIKISSERIEATETQRMGLSVVDTYWKITIADNGIGFEQQYARQIFELFQRLHGRFEYEGTGIGLALCKKIVQSHRGVIEAFGKPGVGAIFNIYLPEKNN